MVIALTYPGPVREAVLEGGPMTPLRNQERNNGRKTKAWSSMIFLITSSPSPSSTLFIPLAFHFIRLSQFLRSLAPSSITKNGCRLIGSSHVVSNTGSLTGEGAEGERQDAASPLTEHRIHLNANNPRQNSATPAVFSTR